MTCRVTNTHNSNCFTIAPEGDTWTVTAGIPVERDMIRLRDGRRHHLAIPLDRHAFVSASGAPETRLYRGEPITYEPGGIRNALPIPNLKQSTLLISRMKGESGTLILVSSQPNATWDLGGHPHFSKTFTWIGAERNEHLIAHIGDLQSPTKKQLLWLRQSDSALCIDSKGFVAKISAPNVYMPPKIERASYQEVRGHLVRYLHSLKAGNTRAEAWCKGALKDLARTSGLG